jgi:drug/metabolite transporter (DMT)-like permease
LLFGVILLNEQLTLLQYIGSALVIAGIVMARQKRSFKSEVPNFK